MSETLSPETSRPVEAQGLPQQLQEITTDMDRVFDQEIQAGTAVRTNPEGFKLSYLQTPDDSTRIQWVNNLANIGAPDDEQVYEIRRELSQDRFRTDQRVLTVYKRPDSEPRGVLLLVRGSVNSAGTMENGSFISVTITAKDVAEFKGVLAQKLAPPPPSQ